MKAFIKKALAAVGAVTLWVLLFIVLGAIFASTANAGDWQVQIAGISKHSDKRAGSVPWNESNAGAGLRYNLTPELSGQVGFYKNSFSKQTNYALVQWTPLVVWRFKGGVFGGYASGYDLKVPLIAGLMLDTKLTNDVSLTARYIPKVNRTTTAVLAVEIGVKFP